MMTAQSISQFSRLIIDISSKVSVDMTSNFMHAKNKADLTPPDASLAISASGAI
jgi:hypothetical protein